MKTRITVLMLLCSLYAHSQTSVYDYACGGQRAAIVWNERKEGDSICLETVQGSKTNVYHFSSDFSTLAWEYSDHVVGTDIRVVLEDGVYRISGMLKNKTCAKTFKSHGLPWYQQMGYHIGCSIEKQPSLRFECIRPDNLKLYKMQAEAKEAAVRDGVREQRIEVRLTGLLSRFFGCDYFVDAATGRFIRYTGVHGPPGTPKTVITLRQ